MQRVLWQKGSLGPQRATEAFAQSADMQARPNYICTKRHVSFGFDKGWRGGGWRGGYAGRGWGWREGGGVGGMIKQGLVSWPLKDGPQRQLSKLMGLHFPNSAAAVLVSWFFNELMLTLAQALGPIAP